MSLQNRLALFTGIAVCLLCLGFSAILLGVDHRAATLSLTDEVRADVELAAYYVQRNDHVAPLPTTIPTGLIHPIQVVDAHGHVVAASRELRGKPALTAQMPSPERTASGVICGTVFGPGRCDIVVAQRVYRDNDFWTVYAASPSLPFYVHTGLATVLLIGTAVFTGAAAVCARVLMARSLAPVAHIQRRLDDIRSTDPSGRVPVPEVKNEIYYLAGSVNLCLNRLERAIAEQRRFSTDASHELRTPIAAMRVQLEDALMAPQDTDVPTLCNAVLPSLDRLEAVSTGLLMLSGMDFGAREPAQAVDLAEVVTSVRGDRLWTKNVVAHLAPGVLVAGQPSKLRDLVGRLLDNAERHARTTITLVVRREVDQAELDGGFAGGTAVLEVLDDGDGIPPDQRETVFERFTRLDAARSRDAGGFGLGLPIARLIAESHGGTLTAHDPAPGAGGARFVLCLPLAPHP
ncbi:HAMP domain-containing sensor histidine kinase [Nonomuraea antimicrobica]|uniref:histidine kinase n=1 Tax=Nonomuraea antimicrobica TaxID=561173 RepID=A0ABP7C087_9ACTN